MEKYHKQTIKNLQYMFSKLAPGSTNFNYKLGEISAMHIIPLVDIYKMAQDYFKVDFSDKIKKLEEFYA